MKKYLRGTVHFNGYSLESLTTHLKQSESGEFVIRQVNEGEYDVFFLVNTPVQAGQAPFIVRAGESILKFFKLNQKVMTPHGKGTIVGFERFDANGSNTAPAADDNGTNRIIVKLDKQENWLGNKMGSGLPHYWHRNIQEAD